MDRPDAVETVRSLIGDRYPQAVQAWLGGSAAAGRLTETSDLDVTVVLPETSVYREALTYAGWPIELFVHTEESVRRFVQLDEAKRQPSMARLVASSIPVLAGDGGAGLRAYCSAVLEEGPAPLGEDEVRLARYVLTDLLDDLDGGGAEPAMDAVIVEVWRRAAELLLASERRWSGSGKWLVREIEALDTAAGSRYATRFHESLQTAVNGKPEDLTSLADEVLNRVGGRLRDGFHLSADGRDCS
ncbi:nucleotidyltransferase domain-containing protein [Kribbella soli]|uniref:Nucleotidyltransferase domain-containing protein n=1 Tax=Kribbella soli TaxID=1124743 RepID=A0A4R0GUM6_9ACTN|nr:nucleotidyltransferase domain-containing protein [Kribbella soli]TCC01527.1 nucleotidyltransferase domain-containing protein [Kribbella soli]